MTVKLYGIPNCNTVKKARDWLSQHHIDYEFCNFKKDGVLTSSLLQQWLKQTAWEKLVNRSGMTWRKLPDERKQQVTDEQSALALMMEKSSVIKRPVLEQDDQIQLLGFDESAYQKLFNQGE